MLKFITFLGIFLFTASTNLVAQKTEISDPIIGSWKLQEIEYQYQDTTYHFANMNGRLIIHQSGTYAVQYEPMTGPRAAFENLSQPSEKEVIAAFRSVVFNSGQYTLKDQIYTTTADIAKVPGFEGGVQYYRYKIEGNHLELVMFDETYPDGKKPDWYQKLEILFRFIRE